MSDAFESVYDRGAAVGRSDVISDTMTFRYRDETFTFPSIQARSVAQYNGYFYEAPIDALRRLEAEAAGG